ncbi:hypothetical protein FACS189452_08450 [Bacteroidia bacterium]|nr:hypothetical protein FACS189452_08450 [Bacteroidia bacterium]
MNKVLIVGNLASGKSTFAKKLHKLTGLELMHLDNFFYNKDGSYKPVEEWIEIIKQIIQKDNWIIDGNYPHTLVIRAEQADTIFIFDLPRAYCILNLFKRYFYHSVLNIKRTDCLNHPKNIFFEIKKIWVFKSKRERFYNETLLLDRKIVFYFKYKKDVDHYLKQYGEKQNQQIGVLSGTVKLESPTILWKQMYDKENVRLKKIFGNKNILIEHVGSTAIPNIKAKPIIDILMILPDETDMDDIIRQLVLAGYYKSSFRLDNEIFMKKTDGISSTHYLHLAKQNQGDWKRYIAFRDYLIQNLNVAQEYEILKKELAEKYTNDRVSYTATKKIYIDNILNKIL